MKITWFWKIAFSALCFTVLVITSFLPVSSWASVYYIAPNGLDDNSGSSSAPWGTFSHAMNLLKPGDTLILKDGTYYQTMHVSISGEPGNPITFKAENDGQVTIDGQGVRWVCYIGDSSESAPRTQYINVEGIRCRNSSVGTFSVMRSDYINVKRVSAYHSGGGNNPMFDLWRSTYALLEDVAASGNGRVMYNPSACDHITIRRAFGYWWSSDSTPRNYMQIYGSDNVLVENNVGILKETVSHQVGGIAVWANRWDDSADYNKIYGNVMYGFNGNYYSVNSSDNQILGNNIFKDNVALGNPKNAGISYLYPNGFAHYSDPNTVVEHMTITQMANGSGYDIRNNYPGTGYGPAGMLKNSDILNNERYGILDYTGTLTHTHDNVYGQPLGNYYGGGEGPYESHLSPDYNIATYGKGGYLMRAQNLKGLGESGADIGAEVLYRSVDGVLTSTPLWPWPMEDRIRTETQEVLGQCVSVTYEDAGNGCTGGLWKSLDGLYAYQPDTSAPSVPQNLQATAISSNQINLSWDAATDNVGVTGYRIYRNGVQITTTVNTSYLDTGLIPNTFYTYTVSAYDGVGNQSGHSNSATAATLEQAVIPDLVAHYTFDEGSGTIAEDSSGNGINGTLVNGPAWITGKNGKALNFDGTDDYVNIAANSAFDSLNEITVTAWIKPVVGSTGIKGIVNFWKSYTDRAYLALFSGSTPSVYNDIDDIGTLHSTEGITSLMNEWVFLSWTYDKSSLSKIYVNGTQKGTTLDVVLSFANLDDGFYATIGINREGTGLYSPFMGSIDEVKIYNRALTAEEILTEYNNSSGVNTPPVLSAIGNKTVNEASTLTITLSATDADNDILTYSVANAPLNSSLAGNTFTFSPDYTQARTYNLTFIVSDGKDTDSEAITITVTDTQDTNTYFISGSVTSGGSSLSGATMTLSGAGARTAMTDANGNYSFTGLTNGSYTITPNKTGYTFTPTNRSITITGANVTGQGFTGTLSDFIPKTSWRLVYVDSQESVGENGPAVNAFDSNSTTIWLTKLYGGSDPLPHEIRIDLGGIYDIDGFRYLPRQDGWTIGRIGRYAFYISRDGINWSRRPVAAGVFANTAAEKEVRFTKTTGRFIRLKALTEVNGGTWTSMAEITVRGKPSPAKK